jgi:hypothetical protein
MTTPLSRPPAGGNRQIKFRTIAMTNERSAALGRAASLLGISRAQLITRLIDSGLSVLLSPKEQ